MFDGSSWTYSRAFRVSGILPGKTLALGVVADDDVYVAYNTANTQNDPQWRWRRWNGVAWSDSTFLTSTLYGDFSTVVLFVVAGGYRTLAFHDGAWGNAAYFIWSGDTVSVQQTDHGGVPSSSLVVGGVPGVFWGAGDPDGCCDSFLLRTSRP